MPWIHFLKFKLLPLGLLTFCMPSVYAQKVDNLASFRDMHSDKYLRFYYDNDYFTTTDENYTQGIQIELVHPLFKNNPINHLFYRPKKAKMKYGLSVEHNGFTPDDIKSKSIQIGDRPFAAAIMLKNFMKAKDSIHGVRWASSLSLGVIGPVAFGYEMQKGIHEVIDGAIPGGWRNQIHNNAVINYRISVEKELNHHNLYSLNAISTARIGSYFTNISIGLNANLGLVPNAFKGSKNNNFQWYVFMQPELKGIVYDATLQGGIFQESSPYVIPTEEIERLVFQANYGMALQTNSLYFEYFRTSISKEFSTGEKTRWGGIRIGFKI